MFKNNLSLDNLGDKMKKVKVYSTPTCPYCTMAKDFLKEHGIKFKEVDLQEDRKAAQEIVKRSGQMGVPVIEIEGELVIGFDEAKLRKLLNL